MGSGLIVRRSLTRCPEPPHLDEVARDVTARDVQPPRQVGQGVALVHGTDVGDAVPRVDDHARQQTCGPTRNIS